MKVKEIMNKDVKLVHRDDTIKTAAERMKEMRIGMVPVVEEDKVAGVVTDRDIVLRAIAEGKDMNTTMSDIMTSDVTTCHDDDEVKKAAEMMKEKQIRRLIVVDKGEKLSGVLSLGDIVSSDTELGGKVLDEVTDPDVETP